MLGSNHSLRPAALLALLAVAGSGTLALAQTYRSDIGGLRPGLRSLDAYQGREIDELDRPGIRERQSQLGWELRGDQITVRARTSRDDAVWGMEQAQQAWRRMEQLADPWTQVHRRPDFGIGAVSVVIDNRPAGAQTPIDPVVRNVDGVSLIYINVAAGEPPLEEQADRLAYGAAISLLNVARLNDKLPQWAQVGMAAQIVDAPLALAPPEVGRPVAAPPAGRVPPRLTRNDHESIIETPVDQPAAAAWFRYLLKGDDAAHAPALFAALANTVADTNEQLHDYPYDNARQLRARTGGSRGDAGIDWTPLDELIRERRLTQSIGAWLTDPLVDQPLPVDQEGRELTELSDQQRQMVVLLKMARRLAVGPRQAVRPKIIAWTAEGAKDVSLAAPASLPIDLATLERRWRDAEPPLATLDADGSLLMSSDANRLNELFHPEHGSYEARWQPERQVLVYTDRQGRQTSAWLEPNEQNPRRPLVKFQ